MNATTWVGQLNDQVKNLRAAAISGEVTEVADPINRLLDAAMAVAEAWSGSNLGYQSHVYYRNFSPVPAGAHFSSEWGWYAAVGGGTTGEWDEYTHDQVIDAIEKRAGHPSLSTAEAVSKAAKDVFHAGKAECLSILAAHLTSHDDSYLRGLRDEIEKSQPLSEVIGLKAQLPRTRISTRDSLAASQGAQAAPHQHVIAHMAALKEPFIRSSEVATLAERAASHIARLEAVRTPVGRTVGDKVFIGHGGTLLWRELKDFVSDRLKLPYDEFNRVPVAGVHTTDRLKQMLDEAGIAFLVMTAEDERADGKLTARQNVIHEVGLFQGRLGFERAIVVLEDGCEEFSNITGLSQIRFPQGRIDAVFEKIRQVLEREGFLE